VRPLPAAQRRRATGDRKESDQLREFADLARSVVRPRCGRARTPRVSRSSRAGVRHHRWEKPTVGFSGARILRDRADHRCVAIDLRLSSFKQTRQKRGASLRWRGLFMRWGWERWAPSCGTPWIRGEPEKKPVHYVLQESVGCYPSSPRITAKSRSMVSAQPQRRAAGGRLDPLAATRDNCSRARRVSRLYCEIAARRSPLSVFLAVHA
jgi:hypothetical protein